VADISQELGMSEATVVTSLSGLEQHGILAMESTSPPQFRYQPRTVSLHAGVESVTAAYEADPLPVVKAVLNKPPRALRTFSDAFLFRRRG
jgi:DNA-binding IclR family transcriptional regulator